MSFMSNAKIVGFLGPMAACLLVQSAAAQSLSSAPIVDPAYGVKAFTVTFPAGWKMQGTVVPGPACEPIPSPAFRAYSPDGLSEIRVLPNFTWTFHPNTRGAPPNGCLNFGKVLTSSEFLTHYEEMIATDGLHVDGPMAIAPKYQQRVDRVRHNMSSVSPDIRASADAAAVRVETPNGSFVIEQRLRTYVECRVRSSGPMEGGVCTAHVDVVRAPKGKLDALVALVDADDLVRAPFEQAWLQRVLETQRADAQRQMAALTRQEQAGNAMLRQQHEQFMQTMQRNHQAFMQQQDASFRTHQAAMAQQASAFHSSMNNANAAMNARSTASSDWVDYALDQQTVTGAGGTVKVSSAYGQTWSNGQNQWYQSNNPNSNPNGVLPGNWTQDTKVHGNGQPY